MYVYWWHVGGLRAVKVGHADDPTRHVNSYRSEYSLSGKDVRAYKLDSGTDAEWVERQLCRVLETKGLRRITFQSGNREEGFFDLGDCTFEDAHELLRDAARHIAFAELSNQLKRQRRHELQAAPVSTPRPQEQQADREHEELRPEEHHTSAPFQFPVIARLWLYLIGAIVVWGLVADVTGGEQTLGPRSATLTEQRNPPIATAAQDAGSSAGPRHNKSCSLVELSDTRIHVSCPGSWAWMRWNGRWAFDSGNNEGDALAFFNASDVARRVVVLPSVEPVSQLSEPVEVKPERLPQSDQAAAPATPPPQPSPRQAVPLPALARPQPPQETPQPRQKCTVSRPKPGYQVYLVTCPNSQAMIGRTVDLATGWMVSESVNGTEAIEFFMRSPYAR